MEEVTVRRAVISLLLSFAALPAAQAQNASPDKTTLPGPFGPPSWDTQYPAKERFLVLDQFDDDAVLDRETGLVWQRAVPTGLVNWGTALATCRTQLVGGRRGWRLPSVEEMDSLLDPKHTNPALPANNPFTDFGPADHFWTATTDELNTTFAWSVPIANAADAEVSSKTLAMDRVWCVRGGQASQNPF